MDKADTFISIISLVTIEYETITMPSKASWHPAFMPNSAVDIISKATPPSNPPPAPEQLVETEEPTTAPITPGLDTQNLPDEDVQENRAAENDDNTGHPELTNLRNALTTSLNSPGGVEFDEPPFGNGTAEEPVAQDKADFPSEGPTTTSKHVSSMSFARTVSEEVSLGGDDEVDHEWNIQRRDSDPFKHMPRSDRTNSFPQVPPSHSPAINFEPLSSQAEEIVNEVAQEPRDLFADDEQGDEADFFAHTAATTVSQGGIDAASTDHHQPYGRDVEGAEDQESQARYEEGLPLVESTETYQQTPPVHAAFDDDDDEAGDGDDFFSQVSKSRDTPEPRPALERKSTSQVMNSFNFQSHEQTHSTLTEETELDATTQKAEETTTERENEQGPTSEHNEESAGPETKPNEGDLAEKWQAALDDDEFLDDDDLLPDDEPNEGKALDPADIFGSDDEGFLEDTDEQNEAQQPNGHVPGFGSSTTVPATGRPGSSSNRYLPTDLSPANLQPKSPYTPITPQFADLSQTMATGGSPGSYAAPPSATFPGQQAQPQRPELPKAESFADKNKGGYSSPYDLPMEVVKPRKRPSLQQINRGQSQFGQPSPSSPPRSASMYSQHPPPSRGSTSSLSPPGTGYAPQHGTLQPAATPTSLAPPPSLKPKSSTSSFFEDLPISSKPKPAIRQPVISQPQSSHVPLSAPPLPSPGLLPPPPIGASYAPPPQHGPPAAAPSSQGLVAPDRVSPYASLPSHPTTVPVATSRYSPAPPQPQGQAAHPPPAQSRYSPALALRQGAPAYSAVPSTVTHTPILPHLPRTSSPLAHFERSPDSLSTGAPHGHTFDRRSSSSYESNLKPHHLPPTREVDEAEEANPAAPTQTGSQTPPLPQKPSPPRRAATGYFPQQVRRTTPPHVLVPPKRSQTQSPGSAYNGNNLNPYQRPASTELTFPPRAGIPQPPAPAKPAGRPRGLSTGFNFIAPTDGQEHDPLQRWKGAPVFCWGVGGTFVTSFPKDVPRYVNQTPMTIRSPGEVKIRNIKDVDPLPERLSSFPGPLKGKSKKKDVIAWLNSGIQILEQDASYLTTSTALTHDDKRTEERILLWKILRVFIEHDGTLEGNPAVDAAVRAVLSPNLQDGLDGAPLYATGAELSGISRSKTGGTIADPVDPAAVDDLRKFLLKGEREKAVWEAVDKRLWGHAMLISNTVSKDLFKQVAQEFVQKEVRNVGENTESLAVLYEVFAGNFEESIDELVPPSARAGFQMVSTSDAAGPSKDALHGLDRWRETLGLVLSNRSFDDNKALNALGKLLSGYGRAEAGHICFLFARTQSVFGGIDDTSSNIVLVGSDHIRQPYEFDKEMEPILLTEVFEYGMSLANTSGVAVSTPHLSVYKLQHSMILAEYGHREKALSYCESIAASITSQTRRSPYHHKLLIGALDDFSQRLKQSPKDEKSSWVSKPSIDKVSSSVWSTFNKFVAGDEVEAGTPGSAVGPADHGPFARIAGGTPTISRAASTTDLYGSYNGGIPINGATTKAGSRYAPGAASTPPSHEPHGASSYQSAPIYGSQSRSSFEDTSGQYQATYPEPGRLDPNFGQRSPPIQYAPQMGQNFATSSPYSPTNIDSQFGQTTTPYAPLKSALTAGLAAAGPATGQPNQTPTSYEPSVPSFEPPHSAGYGSSSNYGPPSSSYEPPSAGFAAPTNGYEPPADSYEPQTNGYEPPTSSYEPPTGSYEPPSYEPVMMDDEPRSAADGENSVPSPPSADASREKTRAEKDREADEAFRKAAEADGMRSSLIQTPLSTNNQQLHVPKKHPQRRVAGVSAAGLVEARRRNLWTQVRSPTSQSVQSLVKHRLSSMIPT